MTDRSELADQVRAAEVVLPCDELDGTLAFFLDQLGFRLESISPADDPSVAVIAGHGVRLRLERGGEGAPGRLRLHLAGEPGGHTLVAPNGTRIELVAADPPIELPPLAPSLVVSRLADARWVAGRAGMRYRDLLPDRQGGRIIASHIQVPDGGPVPDYVHYHRIRFQMIFCARGRVRVVYEDQGGPFWLEEGDSVVQPPGIRHRVLECSPGLEVVEITSPAVHETRADHELSLPTAVVAPDRDFSGQRFAQSGARGSWLPWRWPGLEARDLGVAAATSGLASARVVRQMVDDRGAGGERRADHGQRGPGEPLAPGVPVSHAGELLFGFVLAGRVTLECDGRPDEHLAAGDAYAVPRGLAHRLMAWSPDLGLLEVEMPAPPGAPRGSDAV